RDLREAGRAGFAAIAGIILAAAFITTVTAIAGVAFAFTFVAAVLVAGIADAILIGVGLVRVGDKGTVVHVIGDVIAIDVVVAGIAEIIAVEVGLVGVGNERAVVQHVQDIIAIDVQVAGVTYAVI